MSTSLSNHNSNHSLSSEPMPLSIIRTETVLSKLPIHNLAKRGKINIEIKKKNDRGAVDLRWEVSYNERYGQPRQLAYKLDTLLVNRRIEEAGRPLPKVIRLGSLREICKELEMSEGEATLQIKKAIHQNAGTYITAKLRYKGTDGIERTLEAGFTRYNVVFTGESLPDGRKADAVFLILNEPYWEVLNNAPFRPLDYDYLKQLSPAPQRFYEVISYRVFAALKHKHPHAKISYSDYCTFSAQQRYFDYDHFKKQMYKVHRPHMQSGYLSKVRYEETSDGDGNVDWTMYYTPGAKAKNEYATFARRGQVIETEVEPAGISGVGKPALSSTKPATPAAQIEEKSKDETDGALLDEFTKRGVSEAKARKLLSTLAPGQQALDQLDYGDDVIAKAPHGKFTNPPGFYVSLIENNFIVPETFETRRKKQVREEARKADEARRTEAIKLQEAYEQYQAGELDRHIDEEMSKSEFRKLYEQKLKEYTGQHHYLSKWKPEMIEHVINHAVRTELLKRVSLMSYEDFREREGMRQKGTRKQKRG